MSSREIVDWPCTTQVPLDYKCSAGKYQRQRNVYKYEICYITVVHIVSSAMTDSKR